MSLKQILLARIAQDGPMPFEEFQGAALYHSEHGFFSKGELRSTKAGDFLTSPEVSPMFGETLARFVEEEWALFEGAADADSPPGRGKVPPGRRPGGRGFEGGGRAAFHVVEVGAGSGSLLRPLLEALSFAPEVWAVEASPMAREALTELIDPRHVVDSLGEIPDRLSGVIIANELIDNLPVAIAVRTESGWRERWVGADDDELVLVDAPARPAVVEWCDRFAGPCPVDGFVEVQLEAACWIETALAKLHLGALVLIDYGDTAENLEPRRTEGTLRTYRAHHLGPHPLDEPGETDITVDVNFTALQAVSAESGADVEYLRQDEFLVRLGLRERLSELRRAELALARNGDPLERLRVRSLRNQAETLMHPRGLGDFRVLIARPGETLSEGR